MPILVTPTTIHGTLKLESLKNSASPGNKTVGESDEFRVPLEAADGKWYIILDNTNGTFPVTVSIPSGDFVKGKEKTLGEAEMGYNTIFCADSAFCKTSDGKIRFKITPPAANALHGCGLKVRVFQFLPTVNN